MSTILSGDASDAQIAGFAVALRAKGETPAELAALVRTMQRFAEHVNVGDVDGPLLDTCGSGGDRSGTVNVSTMAALVAAGAGAWVVKHGNRAASSQCGSADVLEALGVAIDLGPDSVARCVRDTRIGFCFAPRFHAAMRFAGPVRRELGTPTTFNFLGPLANPAGVRRQVVGVSDPAMAPRVVDALAELGAERALVVYGHDGLDPAEYGIPIADRVSLLGGDAPGNADVVRKVLDGATGHVRDLVVLNAGAALVAAGLADDLADGCEQARAALDDGRAAGVLDDFVRVSSAEREAEAR